MVSSQRRWVRPLVVLVLVLGATLTQAGPAAAHASLTSVSPVDGAELRTSPSTVLLTFSEGVEVVHDGIRVLDESGSLMPVGATRHPSGHPEQVEASLPTALSPGTFVVDWRVVSDDGHPEQGSSSFSVGGVTRAVQSGSGARDVTPRATTGAMLVARFVALAGLTALVGGLGFLWCCWPAGWAERRSRTVLVAAALATAAASGAQLLAQGAYADGHGFGAAFDVAQLYATLGTRAGALGAVRAVSASAVAAVLVWWPHGRRWQRWGSSCGAGVLAMATAASGHAGQGHDRVVATAIDVVHLGGAALWLGGLLMLLVGPLSTRVNSAQGRAALARYSRLAAICVVLLVATGVVAGARRTGSLGALTQTSYGGVLIVKAALLATILTFAAGARQVVTRRLAPATATAAADRPTGPAVTRARGGVDTLQRADRRGSWTARQQTVDVGDLRRLRQSVVVELALGVVVLVATAWLIGLPTARSTYVPTSSAGTVGFVTERG